MPNEDSTLFSDLLGNEENKQVLRALHAAHAVPQVLLFHGPDGVGKRRFALQLARAIVGKDQPLDLHCLGPEEKSDIYAAESVRILIEHSHLPPQGVAKAFVLDEAHKMLPSSSNALLKTLEEPPGRAYFFLVTAHREALLPTVLSRCRALSFSPLSEEEIRAWMAKHYPQAEAERLSRLAQGSMSKAHLLLREETTQCFALVRALFSLSLPEQYDQLLRCTEALEEILARDASGARAHILVEEILLWLRDAESLDIAPIYHTEDRALLAQCKKKLGASLALWLEEVLVMRNALIRHIRPKVAVEYFFSKWCSLLE